MDQSNTTTPNPTTDSNITTGTTLSQNILSTISTTLVNEFAETNSGSSTTSPTQPHETIPTSTTTLLQNSWNSLKNFFQERILDATSDGSNTDNATSLAENLLNNCSNSSNSALYQLTGNNTIDEFCSKFCDPQVSHASYVITIVVLVILIFSLGFFGYKKYSNLQHDFNVLQRKHDPESKELMENTGKDAGELPA